MNIQQSASLDAILKDILNYKNLKQVPFGFTESEFYELKFMARKEIFELIGVENKDQPILITGHQPEFHHPGILYKDILTDRIAKAMNGIGIHLILDTDSFSLDFSYPKIAGKGLFIKDALHLESKENVVYLGINNTQQELEQFKSILKFIIENQEQYKDIFPIQTILEYSNYALKILEEGNLALYKIANSFRERFIKSSGLQLHSIYTHDVFHLKAFRYYFDAIQKNHEHYRDIYNSSLKEYRTKHKIKNHAQPLPDLKENELPFWSLDPKDHHREKMKFDSIPKQILPMAVSFTSFVRMFLSDCFIHGTGGGRYEVIGQSILEKFFQINPSPYYVATATLHPKPTMEYNSLKEEVHQLELLLKNYEHSPDKLLNPEDPLHKERMAILEEMKLPSSDKKNCNLRLKEINQKIKGSLIGIQQKLEGWEAKKEQFQNIRSLFEERTLPFFFYDIKELIDKSHNSSI